MNGEARERLEAIHSRALRGVASSMSDREPVARSLFLLALRRSSAAMTALLSRDEAEAIEAHCRRVLQGALVESDVEQVQAEVRG